MERKGAYSLLIPPVRVFWVLHIPQRTAASYLGLNREVVLGRRRSRGPFKRPCIPWVITRLLASEVGHKHVIGKDQNCDSLDHASDRDDQVESVPAPVRQVGIDRTWHSQHAKEVH